MLLRKAHMKHPPKPKANPPQPSRSEAALGTFVVRLMDPATSFAERDRLVAALIGKPVAAPLMVERVEQTAGGFDLPESIRQGRTLLGTVEGTKLKVAARFASSRNRELDETAPGLSMRVRGQVSGWDSLFDRLIIDVM